MISIVAFDTHFDRWQELLDLILSSFAYMNGKIDPPSSAMSLTASSLQQKAEVEVGFLALDDGIIVGCLFCRPEQSNCVYIGKLAVSPHAQGKGIGKAMLTKAEEIARHRGCTSLRLETRIELTGNHSAFSALGFEKTAERSHKGFDRVTYIEMCKALV